MFARLLILWVRVRDSLWFLPGLLTLAGAILAMAVTEVERAGFIAAAASDSWLFSGGVEGARGVLGAIAGGLITVTGVVFSVTIVALQLASSQFTPRVLRDFTADRGNQLVLGVFIGTFTYTLLVLRTVRSATGQDDVFVPRLGVAIALGLVLVSIGFLIYFIDHSARSIQVSSILDGVTRRTLRDVQRLFPDQIGEEDDSDAPDPRRPDVPGHAVTAATSGYLQAVDGDALLKEGERNDLVIAMEPQIGRYILAGQPLAIVWPPDRLDDEVIRHVRTAFVIGPERTPEQDIEFGIIEVSDIAVKALSPGINDPTTAFHCIDHLAQILLELGTRRAPEPVRSQRGRAHFIARSPTFERAVGLAYDQILHFGADNPAVVKKLLESLTALADLLPPRRRSALAAAARAVLRSARTSLQDAGELASVEKLAGRLATGERSPHSAPGVTGLEPP